MQNGSSAPAGRAPAQPREPLSSFLSLRELQLQVVCSRVEATQMWTWGGQAGCGPARACCLSRPPLSSAGCREPFARGGRSWRAQWERTARGRALAATLHSDPAHRRRPVLTHGSRDGAAAVPLMTAAPGDAPRADEGSGCRHRAGGPPPVTPEARLHIPAVPARFPGCL